MKKKFLRFVAGVMAFLLFSSGMGSAVAAYAKDEKQNDALLVAKQERVLTVTQDMVGKNGKLTITGEWDRIVVPKEIVASNVFFKDVKTGSVEIESGSKCNFEMVSGEFGTVAVVPAKVEYMTVHDFIALYRLTKDPQVATKKYRDQLEENDKILDKHPNIVTGKDVAIKEVAVSGNAKFDLGQGVVENLRVDADGTQKDLDIKVSNYEGNVSVKHTEREDGAWMIANVRMDHAKINNVTMEGGGRGNIILSGVSSEIKDVNVESAPMFSLNLPSQTVNVAETAKDAILNILARIENILIHASGVKMDVGSCGRVADAKIEGDNVYVSGNGKVVKVDIVGEGAYVSTMGSAITGTNNYIPPVQEPVGGIRDLGGLHVVIGDWYTTAPEAAVTEEQKAQEKYRQEMMEKYNFTVEQKYIANWDDFQDVFRTSVSLGTPAANIFLMDQRFLEGNRDYFYDLSKLYEFDFDAEKWDEDVKNLMTWKDGIYGMSADEKEARGGVFINMDLYEQAIKNAGLSMEDYDPFVLQAKGDWTWSKFEEICGILNEQLNKDWDGTTNSKIYALTSQNVITLSELVYSTGTEFVGYDEAKGEYVNNLTDPNIQKAYEYATGLIEKGYDLVELENPNGDYIPWNWYAERFFDEKAVMQFGEAFYMNMGTSDYGTGVEVITKYNDMDANVAFLCCPKPDEGDGSDSYHTYFSDNVAVMPVCYDEQTAADIAFAYNLWTNPAPGYEEERADEWKERYVHHDWDERSTEETLSIFYNEATVMNQYINFLEDLEKFTMEDEYFEIDGTLFYRWQFEKKEVDGEYVYELGYLLDQIMPYWDETIEAANIKRKLYMPTARPDATFDYNASPYKVEVNPDGTIRLKKHKNPDSQGSEIVIPAELFGRKVVEIAPNAFRGRDITSVTIPEGVIKISPFAFGEDYSLITVVTPESLTTIGDNAFFKCENLQNMNLTKNVTSIGELAFSECWTEGQSNLIITTEEGSYADTFAQAHNIPVQYEGQISEFEYITVTTEWGNEIVITGYETVANKVIIPKMMNGQPVTVVSGGAFKNCTEMESVKMDSICEIKEEAFAGCTNLKTISLSEELWGIQDRAFAGCTALTDVIIPESVTWMATNTFEDCDLDKLVIYTKSEAAIAYAEIAGILCIDLREQQ